MQSPGGLVKAAESICVWCRRRQRAQLGAAWSASTGGRRTVRGSRLALQRRSHSLGVRMCILGKDKCTEESLSTSYL